MALLHQAPGADIPKAPVPKSPYLPVVYRYADTMLKNGRDTYGPQKTGLFLSALDRTTLAPLTNVPTPPRWASSRSHRVGQENSALVGANPQHDQNLLRLLYSLSELSGKPQYREAADASLRWFLENARSPTTQLLPWGADLCWDVMKDQPSLPAREEIGRHRFFGPWMLWDRSFTVAPGASRKFALGLWEHQVANCTNGGFSSGGFLQHRISEISSELVNYGGYYIRTWAVAFAHTKEEEFLRAIDVVLTRYEQKRHPVFGWIFVAPGSPDLGATLSLAIDCDGAAQRVPDPLASRLRAFAAGIDESFGRFVATDIDKLLGGKPTETWFRTGTHYSMTAEIGMMFASRYDNTGKPRYRDLMLNAAEAYFDTLPEDVHDLWPGTMGLAISLELAAWRHTADWKYMERARKLGDFAMEKFWGTNALPRASTLTDHYESVTGAGTLALALLELHLQVLHITAVRCPPNTIDR